MPTLFNVQEWVQLVLKRRLLLFAIALGAACSCSNEAGNLSIPNKSLMDNARSIRTKSELRPQVASNPTVIQSTTCNTDSTVASFTCSLTNSVASGDATVLLIGSNVPKTLTAGYTLVGTVANSTSTISSYYAASGTKSITVTFASSCDVHVVLLEVANGGKPAGFSSAQSSTAPSLTGTASSIVVDMFGEQYGYKYYGTIPSGWTEYYPPSPGSAGGGYNQLDSLVYVGASAGNAYSLTDSPYAIAAAFQIPASATPAPTPSPTYLQPIGVCSKVYTADTTGYCSSIPASPSPNPSSSSDLQTIVADTMSGYPLMANAFIYDPQSQPGGAGFAQDSGFPAYFNPNDSGSTASTATTGLISYAVNCGGAFQCGSSAGNIQSGPIYLPTNARVQSNTDHHITIRSQPCLNGVTDKIGCEVETWVTSQIPDKTGQTLTAQGGGECGLSTAGYSCSGVTAGNAPIMKGAVDPVDALTAMGQTNGVLPYALKCAVSQTSANYIFPSSYYDTGNGGPPNGARFYVPLSIATINSAWAGHPYYAMLVRTLAVHGCFVDDTTGGYAGISIDTLGPSAYTVNNGADPWAAIASAEGVSYTPGGSAPNFPMEGYTIQTLFRECLYRGQWNHPYGTGPYPATC